MLELHGTEREIGTFTGVKNNQVDDRLPRAESKEGRNDLSLTRSEKCQGTHRNYIIQLKEAVKDKKSPGG